ncbi:MAG: mechanosensitive ion channel [Thermoplasmata archaeon]|nr:mechanosensitive ion channel [Thermoplasmata archaeon]
MLSAEVLNYIKMAGLGVALLLGVLLSIYLARLLARWITHIFIDLEINLALKETREGKKRTPKQIKRLREKITTRTTHRLYPALNKILVILFVLIVLIIVVQVFLRFFDLSLGMTVGAAGYQITLGSIINLIVAFVLGYFFVQVLLSPLLESIISVVFLLAVPRKKMISVKRRVFKNLIAVTKFFFAVLVFYISLKYVLGPENIPFWGLIESISVFIMIISGTYIFVEIVAELLAATYLSPEKMDVHTAHAIGKFAKISIFFLGITVALVAIGLDPLAVATSLGLIGFALAFGLQDTVANLAAGIQIAIDKPFKIGDRIRVVYEGRDTWGDVVDIGLRSTRIVTPEGEYITIPNSIMAREQVWNYSRPDTRIAETLNVGISYGSDWRLAEKIILNILEEFPFILKSPRPLVWMKEFGEFSVNLEVRYWIPDARDRYAIRSEVLKRIKDAFDEEGVEIPYPYRTVVFKRELPKEKRFKGEYHSPLILPSLGWQEAVSPEGEGEGELHIPEGPILAATSSPEAARATAPYIVSIARNMGRELKVLYVVKEILPGERQKGSKALKEFTRLGIKEGVWVEPLLETAKNTTVPAKILEVIHDVNPSLVILGYLYSPTQKGESEIISKILPLLDVPVMVIPVLLEKEA